MKYKINNNDGIAFVMVILLLALVGSLATAMLIMNSSNIDLTSDASARSKAFYAAEGGVNYLDMKLNYFYQKKIAHKGIFSAEKIKEELENLQDEIKKDNLKIDNFNIDIDFNTGSDEEDNKYVYNITADNGSESETIKVQYRIEHLIDYFKYSRFANKITITGNSNFGNVDDHSFGTYETLYGKWFKNSSYSKDELIVHNNTAYRSLDDYSAGEAIEPGEDDWNNYWEIDNSFKEWVEGNSYKSRAKVIYNNEIYTSKTKDNKSKPGTNGNWELNNPDLAKEGFANGKVDYTQSALPDPNDENSQEYMAKIIEEFKERLKEEDGYIYEDDQFEAWTNKQYEKGEIVSFNDKAYRAKRNIRNIWSEIKPNSDLLNIFWEEIEYKSAAEKFIDNYDHNAHNNSGKGNYIYIDGDLSLNRSKSIRFSKPDEVIHILVNGEISPDAILTLKGDANIIFYTTSEIVSFDKYGYITFDSNVNLAYFAPFAKFTSDGFNGWYASSMLFNEIELIDQNISRVKTYNEDNPLREGIDPTIAQLTRSFGDPDYDIDNTGPTRLNWSVE